MFVMRVSVLLRPSLVTLALLLAVVAPARAQVGSTTDIIMGKVTGSDSAPVVGARVEVKSAETGITRRKTTNDRS